MNAGLPNCCQLNRYFRSDSSPLNFDTFVRLVEEGEITEDNFNEFFEDPEKFYRIPKLSIYNHSRGLSEMIRLGCYEVVSPNFRPENFDVVGADRKRIEVNLVFVGIKISSSEIVGEMMIKHLKPAKLEHLLAFGVKYPEKQKLFPIVALGTVWTDPCGQRYVPVLSSTADGKRSLGLGLERYHWEDYCRFLAYRE